MPELQFVGKEFVYNHHLTVHYRPLVIHPEKSVVADGDENGASLDDNLIIHGDNLHALKALLPRYAGKVDCIFIDPPYNTGNEGWAYNDNVNSPVMREWLNSNPINSDDLLRHDKWCCLMWPRLKLLWELLSDSGSMWMTIDDNEVAQTRGMLDEIFGTENFIATVIWQKNYAPKNTAKHFSEDHDYILVYAKKGFDWRPELIERDSAQDSRYTNPDNDPRGDWKPGDLSARNYYSLGTYAITTPSGRVIDNPPRGRYWAISKKKLDALDDDGRIWWGQKGENVPSLKRFLAEVKQGVVPQTLWSYSFAGHTQDAKKELVSIMGFSSSDDVFITPKPTTLVQRVLELAIPKSTAEPLILDSFAGSGTTAHAVLGLNARDGGNRRFILVESEDYADSLTGERVRRVIHGYPFVGTQREVLMEKRLNWSALQKNDLVQDAKNTATLFEGTFDEIETRVEDGMLRVVGARRIAGNAPGLGGGFAYCTLGEPLDIEKILIGRELPSFDNIAGWLVHTAFGTTLPTSVDSRGSGLDEWYIGETDSHHVWVIYRDDRDFLRSKEAALNFELAEAMAAKFPDKPHQVFAPAKYVGKAALDRLNPRVEFAPLPFALYRLERGQD